MVRLRKTVVFDRLLARLAVAAPDRCVLKGALALDFRLGDRTRTTKDMDLVRSDAEESATADLIAAQSLNLGDFFVYAVEKAGEILEDEEGGSVRYRVRAELAGRIFEEVTVDIGFSDPLSWQPESVSGPDLLTFADIQPVEVAALPLEQHVARSSMPIPAAMDRTVPAAASRTSSTSCSSSGTYRSMLSVFVRHL